MLKFEINKNIISKYLQASIEDLNIIWFVKNPLSNFNKKISTVWTFKCTMLSGKKNWTHAFGFQQRIGKWVTLYIFINSSMNINTGKTQHHDCFKKYWIRISTAKWFSSTAEEDSVN